MAKKKTKNQKTDGNGKKGKIEWIRRKSGSIKHRTLNKTASNPEWRSGWIEANVFRENRIASAHRKLVHSRGRLQLRKIGRGGGFMFT